MEIWKSKDLNEKETWSPKDRPLNLYSKRFLFFSENCMYTVMMSRVSLPDKLHWLSQSKAQKKYHISQGLYEVEILVHLLKSFSY